MTARTIPDRHLKLKRVYEPAGPATVRAFWSIVYGRAV
jgi:hypothetical protein